MKANGLMIHSMVKVKSIIISQQCLMIHLITQILITYKNNGSITKDNLKTISNGGME
jgi:hypothetical protein